MVSAAPPPRLVELALCWRAPEGVRPARPVADVVGDPAGLGPALPGVPEGDRLEAALAGHPFLRVRIGIHTGQAQERDGDYFGPVVNRAARVMAAIAADPDAMRYTGQVVDVGELADHYGIDDLDGTRTHGNAGRFLPSPVPPPLPDGD